MSKIQKSFVYIALISMLWVLAGCSSDSSEGSKPSSSSNKQVTLSCTGLSKNVAKGGTIEIPDLTCSNGENAAYETWYGIPDGNWEVDPNTNATSYVISVTATCGKVDLWDVPCGTVNVTAASSNSGGGGTSSSGGAGLSSSSRGTVSSSSGVAVTLTCGPVQTSVAKGGTITIPTLTCSNGETATDESWTGLGSGGWTVNANTNSTSYPISVSANCGSVRQTGVSCGTVNVIATSSSSGNAGSSSSRGTSSSSSGNAGSSSSRGTSSSSSGNAGSSSSGNTGSSSSGSRYITCAFSDSTYTVGQVVSAPEIKCFEANGTPYTTTAPKIGNATFTVASGGVAPASLTAWKTNGNTKFDTVGTSVITVSGVGCATSTTAGAPNTNLGATCTPNLTIKLPTPPAPELTCDVSTIKAIAGDSIKQPTVKCGNDTLKTGVTLAPASIWAGTVADTYTVTATAACGGSNKTVQCGALIVHPKLTCGSVTDTITTGTIPPKKIDVVKCGTAAATGTITWLPTSMNTGLTAPGSIPDIKVTATCGISQDANCSGTITVVAPPVPPDTTGGTL